MSLDTDEPLNTAGSTRWHDLCRVFADDEVVVLGPCGGVGGR